MTSDRNQLSIIWLLSLQPEPLITTSKDLELYMNLDITDNLTKHLIHNDLTKTQIYDDLSKVEP